MKRLGRRFALMWSLSISALVLSAGCSQKSCDDFENKAKSVRLSAEGSFKVSVPTAWSVETSRNDQADEMLVKASGSCRIRLLLSSRPLDSSELRMRKAALLDAMLRSSIEHLRANEHQISDYGKYSGIQSDAPAFVIVSTQNDKRVVLSYGAVSDTRNLSIVVLARDAQKSEAVAALVKEIVNSVTFGYEDNGPTG